MKRVFLAGNRGMVGNAIERRLLRDKNILIITRSKDELNLINQKSVAEFFKSENIDTVILAAARVGGIHANKTCRIYIRKYSDPDKCYP